MTLNVNRPQDVQLNVKRVGLGWILCTVTRDSTFIRIVTSYSVDKAYIIDQTGSDILPTARGKNMGPDRSL